jgi:hypothetical protein
LFGAVPTPELRRSNPLFLPIFDASFLPWHLTHQNSLAIPHGLIREREPRLSHIEHRKSDF